MAMTQPNLMGEVECGHHHPRLDGVTCDLFGPHTKHEGAHEGHRLAWEPTGLIDFDSLQARSTDPASSHEAAARDFGIPGGVKGMARDILMNVGDEWVTVADLEYAIFGPGPYSRDEAVGLNKVSTVALKLHREGLLDRRERVRIEYRRKS